MKVPELSDKELEERKAAVAAEMAEREARRVKSGVMVIGGGPVKAVPEVVVDPRDARIAELEARVRELESRPVNKPVVEPVHKAVHKGGTVNTVNESVNAGGNAVGRKAYRREWMRKKREADKLSEVK